MTTWYEKTREILAAAVAMAAAFVISMLFLWGASCASLKTSTGQLNVPLLLSDVSFSLTEACSQQWLPPDVCTFGIDGVALAQAAVAKDPTAARPAAKAVLVDVLAKLPPNNKLAPYFNWLIAIL